jgi:N-hydroxyarylamine O-acetyltransferase
LKLSRYLHRIGFTGNARPTFDTLAAILKCHVCNIPFENLDVQLGIPLTTNVDAAFDKIVERGRGGWCYEQNGLFGWALSEIGFAVTRVAAAVHRAEHGEASLANHLSLLVRAPDDPALTYLADVGFGGSMIRPIALAETQEEQTPFRIGLRRLDDGYWQFQEESGADSVSFDFMAEPGDEDAMSMKCERLQTDPDSSFVLNLVVQRRAPGVHVCLRGRVLTTNTASGRSTRIVDSASELTDLLETGFGLDVGDIASVWSTIDARHQHLFED